MHLQFKLLKQGLSSIMLIYKASLMHVHLLQQDSSELQSELGKTTALREYSIFKA